jgi:hypothetical protein
MMTNTPIQRELPKVEGRKELPKEYVEAWEYGKGGKVVEHTIHGFKKKTS